MAVTFSPTTTYSGAQTELGTTLTVLNSTSFTGTNLLGTITGVTLNGTITTPTSTISSNVVVAGLTVSNTSTYLGYSGTGANTVYYFNTAAVNALGLPVSISYAVSPGGAVPALSVATTVNTSQVTAPVCFVKGTLILTDRGEVAIEALQPGDLVATAAQGASPEAPAFRTVRFVGMRRYDLTVAGNEVARPVRVRAGALGNGLPHRDLLVSADHSLFLDGHLVPAKFLVNGTTITLETALAEVTYFHVELDSHDLLFSEGALSESWLDNGNRSRFSNAAVVALRATDEAPRAWNEGACHPHLIEGAELDALHARLAALGESVVAEQQAVAA